MRATINRWGRGLTALFALLTVAGSLGGCTVGREPAYDAALAGKVTELTAQTLRLFVELKPGSGLGYADRAPRYADLTGRAATIQLMAEARGSAAPPGPLVSKLTSFIGNSALAKDLTTSVGQTANGNGTLAGTLAGDVPAKAAKLLKDYNDATPAYMADYLRNLADLESADRAANGDKAAREAAYKAALTAYQNKLQAYLDAFRKWQTDGGTRPQEPGAAPKAPPAGLDPSLLALRRTAIEDILRDTLVYERDILNRNR